MAITALPPPDVTQDTPLSREAGPLTTVFTTPDFCGPSMWHYPATPALSCPQRQEIEWVPLRLMLGAICPMGYTKGFLLPTSLASRSNGTPFLGGVLAPGERHVSVALRAAHVARRAPVSMPKRFIASVSPPEPCPHSWSITTGLTRVSRRRPPQRILPSRSAGKARISTK
ncbi:hypothetical protein PGQ11_007971 [Apiospora arundinis]|uniref:Uncharacterized protein n=1 Tax=Apiospora arundinis TaxID=335852 RepID=A0ABR2IYL1_9PEZI